MCCKTGLRNLLGQTFHIFYGPKGHLSSTLLYMYDVCCKARGLQPSWTGLPHLLVPKVTCLQAYCICAVCAIKYGAFKLLGWTFHIFCGPKSHLSSTPLCVCDVDYKEGIFHLLGQPSTSSTTLNITYPQSYYICMMCAVKQGVLKLLGQSFHIFYCPKDHLSSTLLYICDVCYKAGVHNLLGHKVLRI